jgi:formylglycine-generating enzyme required for sulfatase activity
MRVPLLVLTLASLAAAAPGCLDGKAPPDATRTVPIPGGTFTLGSGTALLKCASTSSSEEERCDAGKTEEPLSWIEDLTFVPTPSVTISGFEIDEHEVTNRQYAYCVEKGACSRPAFEDLEGGPYYGQPEHDNSPVVYVTRAQAKDYCLFRGLFLPTEAQWERAARLGQNGTVRTYPWEGTLLADCTAGSKRYAVSNGCAELPVPVDYSEADVTYHQVRNMASNVSEWVLDDWSEYAYCEGGKGYDESCQTAGDQCKTCISDGTKCAGSCRTDLLVLCKSGTYSLYQGNSTEQVVRGGSYLRSRCFHRLFVRRKETAARSDVGFRCAR